MTGGYHWRLSERSFLWSLVSSLQFLLVKALLSSGNFQSFIFYYCVSSFNLLASFNIENYYQKYFRFLPTFSPKLFLCMHLKTIFYSIILLILLSISCHYWYYSFALFVSDVIKTIISNGEVSPCCMAANMLDCDIVIIILKLQSWYYVQFWTDTSEKLK